MAEPRKIRFSIRAILALTAAFALWLWVLDGIHISEAASFAAIAMAAGLVAHLVYVYWLPWRVTGVVVVFLVYNLGLLAICLWETVGTARPTSWLDLMAIVFFAPAKMLMSAREPNELLLWAKFAIGMVVMTPAHMIRPCLPTALITALGIGIWYAAGILITMHGG